MRAGCPRSYAQERGRPGRVLAGNAASAGPRNKPPDSLRPMKATTPTVVAKSNDRRPQTGRRQSHAESWRIRGPRSEPVWKIGQCLRPVCCGASSPTLLPVLRAGSPGQTGWKPVLLRQPALEDRPSLQPVLVHDQIREAPIPERVVAHAVHRVGAGHRLGGIQRRARPGSRMLRDMPVQEAEVHLGAGDVARLPIQIVPIHHQFIGTHLAETHPAAGDLAQLIGVEEARVVVELVVRDPGAAVRVGDGRSAFERQRPPRYVGERPQDQHDDVLRRHPGSEPINILSKVDGTPMAKNPDVPGRAELRPDPPALPPRTRTASLSPERR